MEKLEKFAEAVVAALTGKSIGYGLILGLVISLCVTSVTILLLVGMPALDHHPPVQNGWSFLGEFLVLFILVASLAVLMTTRENDAKQREAEVALREARMADRERAVAEREADDLLSGFRKQIAGIWEMNYRSWRFNAGGEPEEHRITTYARFDVNSKTKKLVMHTRVRPNGDFDEDNISVEAITLWPVPTPKHLDYFHDLSLSHDHGEVIRGPVFVHLDIEFEGDQPTRLKGTWYDLDGNFARAIKDSFVREHGAVQVELPLRGRILFTKLEAPMAGPNDSVDQSMQLAN